MKEFSTSVRVRMGFGIAVRAHENECDLPIEPVLEGNLLLSPTFTD